MRINESDQNDANRLAELARMGWYREAAMKGADSGKTRSMLAARTKLLNLRRDRDDQMRGLCKGLGIVLGKAGSTNLTRKVNAVLAEAPNRQDIFAPPLLAQSCLAEQIEKSDQQLLAMAKGDQTIGRMMSVPWHWPPDCPVFRRYHCCPTARVYSFEAPPADDKKVVGTPTPATNSMPRQRLRSIPNRFNLTPSRSRHSADVGAYLGLALLWQNVDFVAFYRIPESIFQ